MRSGIKVTWRFIEKNSHGGNIEEADRLARAAVMDEVILRV